MALFEDSSQLMAEPGEPSMVSVPEARFGGHQDTCSKTQTNVDEIPIDLSGELRRQDSNESTDSCCLKEEKKYGNESEEQMEIDLRNVRSVSVVSDVSEEGGPDSGIEAEKDPDMVIPEQDLIDRIVTQVEIYFSDDSIMNDKFLLKHIRRNKEGYVSLKLVSSFKKVKQLTKDWRVVAYALTKCSAGIQINDLGTKIRRTSALPDIDDTPVTCTILAMNLPLEKPGIDTVSQLFGKCGDIALIRVLRAGSTLSADVKSLTAKYPDLLKSNCAWIEFEVPDAAKEACKLSSEQGMHVVPIVLEDQKKTERQNSQKTISSTNSRKNSNASSRKNSNARKHSVKNLNYYKNENDTSKLHAPQRRKAISLPYNQRPNIRELNVIVEGRRRPKSKSLVEVPGQGSSPQQQSWMQRHLFAAAAASAASAASPTHKTSTTLRSRVSLGSLQAPDSVLRFPKGPDGSRGFGCQRFSEITNEKTM